MKNFKKGFTLIELLVVIAIIGILSSIVLASLSSARTKGEDAAIKANLANMRAQAELYYANNNGYGAGVAASTGACDQAGTIFAATTGLDALVEATKVRTTVTCAATATTTWAVSALLKDGSNYCVDSTGAAKASSTATVTGCN